MATSCPALITSKCHYHLVFAICVHYIMQVPFLHCILQTTNASKYGQCVLKTNLITLNPNIVTIQIHFLQCILYLSAPNLVVKPLNLYIFKRVYPACICKNLWQECHQGDPFLKPKFP